MTPRSQFRLLGVFAVVFGLLGLTLGANLFLTLEAEGAPAGLSLLALVGGALAAIPAAFAAAISIRR